MNCNTQRFHLTMNLIPIALEYQLPRSRILLLHIDLRIRWIRLRSRIIHTIILILFIMYQYLSRYYFDNLLRSIHTLFILLGHSQTETITIRITKHSYESLIQLLIQLSQINTLICSLRRSQFTNSNIYSTLMFISLSLLVFNFSLFLKGQ